MEKHLICVWAVLCRSSAYCPYSRRFFWLSGSSEADKESLQVKQTKNTGTAWWLRYFYIHYKNFAPTVLRHPEILGKKNAHIFSNVCQVYKGEIEEKLLSRYCKPLNGRNYLAEHISGQALPSFFAITALFLSKNIQKRKNKKNRILFFSISIKNKLHTKKCTHFFKCVPSLQRRNRGETS